MREYKPRLSISVNRKGVIDIDTIKGCTLGMKAHPNGGCYGLCYANRMAACRGFDFRKSVSRQPYDEDISQIEQTLKNHPSKHFRIGVMGDPSHDWPLTLYVCEWLGSIKTPVIVTKHWRELPGRMAERMARIGVVFNTSISPLDTDDELEYRLHQFYRLARYGAKSALRMVTADFGDTKDGRYLSSLQNWLFMNRNIIDTPLRIPKNDSRVLDGTINLNVGNISLSNHNTHTGACTCCPDKCGTISKRGD